MSLIVAIGSQNAFALRQGIARRHVLAIVLFCAFSDAVLIAIGSAGFGSLVASSPYLRIGAGFGGTLFLLTYGLRVFAKAIRPHAMICGDAVGMSLWQALATVAALTFLNPHVYLDTVVLLGGIAGRYPIDERIWFAGGAMTASAVWFFALGYGARLLAPVFAKPVAWRVLDSLIGVVMIMIAVGLAQDAVSIASSSF